MASSYLNPVRSEGLNVVVFMNSMTQGFFNIDIKLKHSEMITAFERMRVD